MSQRSQVTRIVFAIVSVAAIDLSCYTIALRGSTRTLPLLGRTGRGRPKMTIITVIIIVIIYVAICGGAITCDQWGKVGRREADQCSSHSGASLQ